MKKYFRIVGLDCAEEASVLKREVGKRAGVLELDFDILNARMRVTYDPVQISPEGIVAAVRATGMDAIAWEKREEQKRKSFWSLHGRLLAACASGILLVAGFATHWLLHGSVLDALSAEKVGEKHVFPLLSIVLCSGSVVTGAWYIFPKTISSARRLRPDVNLLMMIAVIGAMALGEWFEAATVTFLFAVALLLEHWSVGRARKAIASLIDLSPPTARCLLPEKGQTIELPVSDVKPGTIIVVKPGEKIPLDGQVLRGTTGVNQAPITGESIPVPKGPGDEVFAGTINGEGAIELRVTKPAKDTTLARIIRMVEEAQSRRAHSERWVDGFARWYTPVMMGFAFLVVVVPPLLLSMPWSQWIYRGLVILVIACPCALVISTPVSIVSGLASAARHGVLVKGGVYLEMASRIRVVALDKTGTLTRGVPEVQETVPLNQHTPEELLARAAALETYSEHPLASAVLRRAQAEGLSPLDVQDFKAIHGKGAEGLIEGRVFWIGSHRLMEEKGQETREAHEKAEELGALGHSVIAVGNDEHVCGLLSVADPLRPDAARAVRWMKRVGVEKVVMLTGDNKATAQAVARATGVDEFVADMLPEDKVTAVQRLVRDYGDVAMVGDGVNDAPAMASVSMGIAMGAMGTDVALETADVALMSDDLLRVPWLIGHSRRTLAIIKQNIVFALGVKFLFLVLALGGLASLWMAIAADTGASLVVIFNGLRLLRSNPKPFR